MAPAGEVADGARRGEDEVRTDLWHVRTSSLRHSDATVTCAPDEAALNARTAAALRRVALPQTGEVDR